MPVTVRPGFQWPPEVDPVVSPDGILTVLTDQANAGAYLRADYSADPTVKQVRFMRNGVTVRSGDPAWAPGGWANAYDHELPLGTGATWHAVPILWDGTEGPASAGVSSMVTAPEDGLVWVKSVLTPDRSMLLPLQTPDYVFESRVEAFNIPGSALSAASWDMAKAPTTELSLLVSGASTESRLMELLDSGPLVAQAHREAGLPEHYFLAGDRKWEHIHWDGYPVRRISFAMNPVIRPSTVGTPMRIPGLSYDTVARDWDTYTQLADQVDTYNALLEAN